MTTTPTTYQTISSNDRATCPLARQLPSNVLLQTGLEDREGKWIPVISLAAKDDGRLELYDFRTGEETWYGVDESMDAVRDFHAAHAGLED